MILSHDDLVHHMLLEGGMAGDVFDYQRGRGRQDQEEKDKEPAGDGQPVAAKTPPGMLPEGKKRF